MITKMMKNEENYFDLAQSVAASFFIMIKIIKLYLYVLPKNITRI